MVASEEVRHRHGTNEARISSRVAGVTYDSYVRIRDDRHKTVAFRMAYHDGVLESHVARVPPRPREPDAFTTWSMLTRGPSESPARRLARRPSVRAYPAHWRAKAARLTRASTSATWSAFSLTRETLDLTVDPPPRSGSRWITGGSSQVEAPSVRRAPACPRSGVTACARRKLWFRRLAGDRPADRATGALVLPGLTPALVLDLLDRGAKTPAAAWSKWLLTEWFPSHRAELGL